MSDGYHFKDEANTVLELDSESDISSATVKQIHIHKPDGTESEHDATLEGTTKLRYTIPIQDQVGTWKAQIYVELPSGWEGHGRTFTWSVYDRFATPD